MKKKLPHLPKPYFTYELMDKDMKILRKYDNRYDVAPALRNHAIGWCGDESSYGIGTYRRIAVMFEDTDGTKSWFHVAEWILGDYCDLEYKGREACRPP